MKKQFLPVVIASYNRLNLLKQTIESLKKNSFHNIKIIIIDNSTDEKTIQYLESLKNIILYRWKKGQRRYEHLRVKPLEGKWFDVLECKNTLHSPYYNHKWSLGKSRTKGAEIAPLSKYIYFSDNDVYFLPNWDKLMIQAMEEYSDLVIVGGTGQHGETMMRSLTKGHQVFLAHLQCGNSMLFKRQEWEQVGWFPDYDEDSWMSYEITSRFNKKIGVIIPHVILHCGQTSTYRSGLKVKGWVPTFDMANIEANKIKYPNLIYE